MSAQSPMLQQANLLSGRQMTMLAIIAMHALIIAALMTMKVMPDAVPQFKPVVITINPPEDVPPPAPPELTVTLSKPEFTIPRILVPNVIIPSEQITAPVADPAPIAPVVPVAPPAATGNNNVAPAILATPLQYRAVRSPDDYYPSASLSLQEEGTSIVQVCVAPTGRIDGAPTILESSGSKRLDAAALKWASEALRFTPATEGGVPVSACKGFRVHFKLR